MAEEFLKFMQKVERDHRYICLIPLTISLHKFESQYQDFAKPRIFIRECEEFGLTEGFFINKIYQKTLGKNIDEIMEDLNQNSKQKALETLDNLQDNSFREAIKFMALGDSTECELYKIFRSLNPRGPNIINQMPHLLKRKYDEKGVPVAYSLNPHSASFVEVDGRTCIKINGFPITDEEMKKADMDNLLKLLTKPSD